LELHSTHTEVWVRGDEAAGASLNLAFNRVKCLSFLPFFSSC